MPDPHTNAPGIAPGAFARAGEVRAVQVQSRSPRARQYADGYWRFDLEAEGGVVGTDGVVAAHQRTQLDGPQRQLEPELEKAQGRLFGQTLVADLAGSRVSEEPARLAQSNADRIRFGGVRKLAGDVQPQGAPLERRKPHAGLCGGGRREQRAGDDEGAIQNFFNSSSVYGGSETNLREPADPVIVMPSAMIR